MKTKLGILILVLAAAWARAQTNDLTSLLQQGLFEEQANRNLDAAIASYQSLATQFDKDRQLAATAVFRIGECYRMQGKTNEAAAQYQRILKDFSDQTTLATLSRQNLTGMGMPESPMASSAQQRQIELLEKQIALAQQNVAAVQKNFQVGVATQTEVNTAEQQVVQLQITLAGLNASPAAANAATAEESQEIQRIQTMIQNSPDLINAPNSNGNTPLEKAAFNGWLKVATFLLGHGADVDARGGLALGNATMAGNRAMVEFLLSRGANVNANGLGKTALATAAEKDFQAVAEVLIAHKADVNATDNRGETPLHMAVARGQIKIVQMLLAADANVNVENNQARTPLSYAAENGSAEMVKMLLAAKADPNGDTLDAPLLVAIHAKDTNSAELLLQAGANPNEQGRVNWDIFKNGTMFWARDNPSETPLFLAVSAKQFPMVQLLLKYKADPNDSQTDRRAVIFNALNETNILEALLDAGAKVDVRDTVSGNGGRAWNWTPLLYAVQSKSDTDSVEILLKHGANPNVHDSNGDTPLHLAAVNVLGKNVFQWLLDSKADPNVRNDGGKTPLDILKWVSAGNYSNISSEQKALPGQLVDFLRQHGALDKLPDWNSITVSRPAANFSFAILHKGTNDWNQFTLLEAILNFYESSQSYSVPQGNNTFADYSLNSMLPFPDLTHVVILRPSHDSTNEMRIVVNLLNSTNGIDCAKDVPLEFGDVVEIPEREYSLGEGAVSLTAAQFHALADYVKGSAKLIAHGQTVELSFDRVGNQAALGVVLKQPAAQKALLSSSDLSRVKVIRHDPKTGKTREWILNCNPPESSANGVVLTTPISYQWINGPNNSSPSTDLWLRDGDVIEVPEK